MKTNQINLIVAKKGAGKTTIATALAYSQNKKVIWITPIKGGFFKKKVDLESFHDMDLKNNNEFIFLEIEKEDFNKNLRRVINISQNQENGLFLVIDELDYYHNSHIHNSQEIYKAVNYGRHAQLDLTLISRRIQDVPANICTNCDYFFLGKNANVKNDVKYYQNFMRSDIIEFSKHLETGEFLKIEAISQEASIIKISQDALRALEKE